MGRWIRHISGTPCEGNSGQPRWPQVVRRRSYRPSARACDLHATFRNCHAQARRGEKTSTGIQKRRRCGMRAAATHFGRNAVPPIPNGRHQPLRLHLVRRRSPPRRLQAVRLRKGDPPVHRAAPPRLRARAHQGSRARAGQDPQEGEAQPRCDAPPRRQAELLQRLAARPQEAGGRPGQHRRQPALVHPRLLPRRARHLRAVRLRDADRPAGEGEPPLHGHGEVRDDRPPPAQGVERRDGLDLRGAHPQVRRTLERDRRRALHAARGHPPDGQPPLHRGRRGAHRARRRAHPVRPDRGHGRHAQRGRRPPARDQPQGAPRDVRAGAQPRVLRHLQGRHAHQGAGHQEHPPGQHALGGRPRGRALRLHAVEPALRRRVEEDREGGPQGARGQGGTTAASAPGSRA